MQLLNRSAKGIESSLAHSLNILVSIPTSPLEDVASKPWSFSSTSFGSIFLK